MENYVLIFKKNWKWIVLLPILVGVLTAFLISERPTLYTATSTLIIEPERANVISIDEIYSGINSSRAEYYETQFEVLRSTNLLVKVIERLNLEEVEELKTNSSSSPIRTAINKIKSLTSGFIPKEAGTKANVETSKLNNRKFRSILGKVNSRLTISAVPKTQLVNISFDAEDPVLAADVANMIGEIYIESYFEERGEVNSAATDWLTTRVQQLKEALDESENELNQFLVSENLIDLEGIDTLITEDIQNVTKQLNNLKERRLTLQSLLTQTEQTGEISLSSLLEVNSISNSPQLRDLRLAELQAEKNLSELSERYGPKHDKMIQVNAELRSIKLNIESLVRSLANGIDRELTSIQSQEKIRQQDLFELREKVQALSFKKAEYDSLKTEVETNKALLDLFITRQKETSATSDFSTANAKVTNAALVPFNPSSLSNKVLVLASAILTFFLALAFALIKEPFYDTIEKISDLEDKLEFNALGSLPRLGGSKKQENKQAYTYAVSAIKIMLLLSLKKLGRKSVTITSSLENEGKSTFSLALAKSFDIDMRVLLIDADIIHSTITKKLLKNPDVKGLTNLVFDDASFNDCIITDTENNFDILPCGNIISEYTNNLIPSNALKLLVDEAEKIYDLVIVDASPVLLTKDALVMAQLTGGAIVMVKAEQTKIRQIEATNKLLARNNINIDGYILNSVANRFSGNYRYYVK